MAKETATYISQLVATNPVASDSVSVGDDHLRMLKTVLKTQFSGLSGTTAVTASEAEMNYLDIATLGTSADSKVLTQASGVVTIAGDVKITGTTPLLTIGDAGAEDTTIVFDGNAKDFYVALDDSADKLLIGEGSTVGTNPILSLTDDTVTLGDGAAVDTAIVFDGNAKDFHIALDDSADKLIIGEGSTVGTNEILSITDDTVTIGDGAAVDTYLNFDGNAADFRIGIDDGTDKLEIGGGVAHGTAAGISMDVNGDMTLGGGIACADEVIGRPRFTDYAETKVAMSANAVDLSLGNVQTYTLSGNQTLTFTNPPATGNAGSFTLIVTNGGSATLTWPTSVDWAGGSAPSLTSSGIDILTFMTIDGGTIWYGFAAGTDMK